MSMQDRTDIHAHHKIDVPIRTQVRAGKYMMGFYENDCESNHDRKKATWERVAFVYDKKAQTQTIVVDGAVVITCTDKTHFEGTDTVYLGRWGNGLGEWKGQISNVKIFNRALTTDQIDAIQRKK